MKYVKYLLIGLAVVALISVIVAGVYAIGYFKDKSAATKLQSDAVTAQASLTKPTISLDGLSCDIAPDAKTQYYSVVIRTPDSNISRKQSQIEDRIKALGGTVISTGQAQINDRDAGYSNSATISAVMPIQQSDNFISQVKGDVVTPDYWENESNYIQDRATIKQACQTNLDYMKNFSSTEALYLSQLNSDQAATSPFAPISDKSNLITKNLVDIRQNAFNYKNSIESTMNQIGKVQITITIKIIPG